MSTHSNTGSNIAIISAIAIFGTAAAIFLLRRYHEEISAYLHVSKNEKVSIDDRLSGIEEALGALKYKMGNR